MLMMGATLIFASTPATRESPCKTLLEGKNRGKHVTKFFNFEFTCPGCQAIQATMPSFICPHRIHWRPMHQNPEILYIARAAYGEGSDDFKREIMGTDATSANAFIHPRCIDSLRESPRVRILEPPQFVWVACDPCGSTKKSEDGTTSDYAFVVVVFQNGVPVVSLFFYFFEPICSFPSLFVVVLERVRPSCIADEPLPAVGPVAGAE